MTLSRKTLQQAQDYSRVVLASGLVPYVAGSPGVGKSAMFAKIAKQYNLKMIDIRLAQEDPTTINGFPCLDNGRSKYLPPELFPLEFVDQLPLLKQFERNAEIIAMYDHLQVELGSCIEGSVQIKAAEDALVAFQEIHCYAGWLIFLDELPSAPRSVQAAAYKIILDKMIGQQNLHPKCLLAAAGNLMDDNAIVNEMGTALKSRMVHVHVDSDAQDYINYTVRVGYDTRITSYLAYQKNKVNNFKAFNANSSDETFCCERTWEFVNKMLPNIAPDQATPIPDEYIDLLCGTIGSTALEFAAYTAAFKDLPTLAQVMANPSSVMIPEKAAVKYLLMGMLVSNANQDNVDVIMDYVSRFSKEYGFIFVKMLWAKSNNFLKNAKVKKLFMQVGDMMLG